MPTYTVTPALTFTSQTGYNHDFLWSTEDYNRFDTTPGMFLQLPLTAVMIRRSIYAKSSWLFLCRIPHSRMPRSSAIRNWVVQRPARRPGSFDEHAWQLSQEFRLASNFSGPFNFSVGGNYLHYETEENYYVFINALTAFAHATGTAGSMASAADIRCRAVPNCLFDKSRFIGGYQNPNPIAGGGDPAQ